MKSYGKTAYEGGLWKETDENNDVLRYNVFHAELVIRHSEDNRLYLYDIINIKKETSTPLEP